MTVNLMIMPVPTPLAMEMAVLFLMVILHWISRVPFCKEIKQVDLAQRFIMKTQPIIFELPIA
jgi:hypothetical protein